MSNAQNDKKEKDWKRKYFDSLKELESNEKKWSKIEQVLRLAISRISLITQIENDQKLHDQIDLLRKSLREGTPSSRLVLLIEDISEAIKNLPDDQEQAAQENSRETQPPSESSEPVNIEKIHSSTVNLLMTILDSMRIEKTHKKTVNQYRKSLKKQKNKAETESNNEQLIENFSNMINGLITPKLEIADENKEIITSENKDSKVDEDAPVLDAKQNSLVAPAVGELLLQLLSRFPPSITKLLDLKDLGNKANSARNRKDLLQLIDIISKELSLYLRSLSSSNNTEISSAENFSDSNGEILIHLLQRISLPDYLAEQAGELKKQLENGVSNNDITEKVEATADLIMQLRVRLQQEKQELEQFLAEIGKHLKALDIDIQVTSRLRDESSISLQQYDKHLEDEVLGIETSLKDATDLNGLKELVTTRVKTIRLHMGAFRKSEEQRNTSAEQTIRQLTNRINDMQEETETLRQQVLIEHHTAVRDALTKIPNRLAYEERITSELERCSRYNTSMAFVIWDIDHFKGINDHYGHIAGDKVLAVIADLVQKNIRAADFIARYGGEEFVVIMPETDIDMAQQGCEKIRIAIENCNFHYRDTSVPITASCGYTTFKQGDDKESLFERSDKALYLAKDQGRNRCVRAN